MVVYTTHQCRTKYATMLSSDEKNGIYKIDGNQSVPEGP